MIPKSLILLTLAAALASPIKKEDDGRVLYDQRQEGEWNVHADLKNFVILVIPATQAAPGPPAGASLLDLLSKAVPKRPHMKRFQQQQQQKKASPETMHFIESKTAPYHVDISKAKSHLAQLHPEEATTIHAEEILLAKSPNVALLKEEVKSRGARAFVLTVPSEEIVITKKAAAKKEQKKFKSELKLLGAENEQCGPERARDAEGICRSTKQ